MEMEGCVGYDFLDLKWTCLFHLKFLESSHMEIGCLQPDLISDFLWRELCSYPLLHLLLDYLVGSLGIVSGSE